jgi:hypothetical protein
MISSSDYRRAADGSIDFDFYRREAARQRGLVQRRLARRLRRAIIDIARVTLSLARNKRPPQIALRKRFT